jgi:hypothetical protein
MPIQIVPYTEEWTPQVLAFNARLHATGTSWGWYGTPVDDWLPDRDHVKTWREHWLAIEDGASVRGAYALKPHEWCIKGEPHIVTDWQGPVSEGLIDARYSALGLRLLREMLKQRPLLYSWGHGGLEQPMLKMLEKLGWLLHPTPLCVRVTRPFRFLRENAFLRSTPVRRAALDTLAFSGAGSVGLRMLHGLAGLRGLRAARDVQAETFESFGPWADSLWERCRGDYQAIAARDASTMSLLVNPGRWSRAHKLRVLREGAVLGWAVVMDTPMQGDARFGSLRVGSIVDCLARPHDAVAIVRAAFAFLRARGVDLVVSNQAHPAWLRAFTANGFWLVPASRVFAASPALHSALEPWSDCRLGLHLTNMDGHGPMAL